MATIVFLVHGVGDDKQGWARAADGPVPCLRQLAAKHGLDPLEPDAIQFVEVLYNDIFDAVLKQWDDLSAQIVQNAPALQNTVTKVSQAIQDATHNPNTFLRYGGDVMLYAWFPTTIGRLVRLKVMSTVTDKIADIARTGNTADHTFAFIAHSLGTAVLHDALQSLATSHWVTEADIQDGGALSQLDADYKQRLHTAIQLGGDNPYRPGSAAFRPFSWILQLANTTRVIRAIRGLPEADDSLVGPQTAQHPLALFYNFINVHHVDDPICLVKPYEIPERWRDAAIDIPVEHVFDPNVHAFNHYLSNPRVYHQVFARCGLTTPQSDAQIEALYDSEQEGGGRFKLKQFVEAKLKPGAEDKLKSLRQQAQAAAHEQGEAVAERMVAIQKGWQNWVEEFRGGA